MLTLSYDVSFWVFVSGTGNEAGVDVSQRAGIFAVNMWQLNSGFVKRQVSFRISVSEVVRFQNGHFASRTREVVAESVELFLFRYEEGLRSQFRLYFFDPNRVAVVEQKILTLDSGQIAMLSREISSEGQFRSNHTPTDVGQNDYQEFQG